MTALKQTNAIFGLSYCHTWLFGIPDSPGENGTATNFSRNIHKEIRGCPTMALRLVDDESDTVNRMLVRTV